jgi:uncharacterized protein (DUF1697 family)
LVAKLPERIAAAIEKQHGLRVPVVLRSAAELERIAARNPFLAERADPSTLHVAFLAAKPAKAALAALDPDRSPPDRFVALGMELYLHCPNGLARTKLTNAWLDSTLKTTSTVRNWKTVLRLVELCSGR